MKILSCLAAIALIGASAFASDIETEGRQASFDRCISVLKNIFSQSSSQAGKDGINITCTVMPGRQMTAVAWKIENPGNALLATGPDGIMLYSDGRIFDSIDTKEALDLFYRWSTGHDVANETHESFIEAHNMPEEDMDEASFYDVSFRTGSSDDSVIYGIVYFACVLKDVASVTAEIRINGESYKFLFDGGGP
jgi:hypothetical protein